MVGEEAFEERAAVFGVYVCADGVGVEVDDVVVEEGVQVGFDGGSCVGAEIIVAGKEEAVYNFRFAGKGVEFCD